MAWVEQIKLEMKCAINLRNMDVAERSYVACVDGRELMDETEVGQRRPLM